MRLFLLAALTLVAVLAIGGRSAHPGEAAWPGVNGLLAYVETQTQEFGGIYTNNEAGTQEERIETESGNSPSWSPDGTKLVFGRHPDDLYTADPNGSNVDFIATGVTPSWAPDGERIVYSKNGDIFIADPPTETNLTGPSPDFVERSPVVSPDGQLIAYVRHPENAGPFDIWVMDIDGDNAHPITDGATDTYFNDSPDWSPDGTRIVFRRQSETTGTDIWIMDANGDNMHNITNTPNRFEDNPAWSPDGQRIAFLMNRSDSPSAFAQPSGSPPSDIWTMNTSGGELHNVTTGTGITGFDEPDWQPLASEAPDLIWGDIDCDGDVDEQDVLLLLLHDADIGSSSPRGGACPAIGDAVETVFGPLPWGDWNCVDGPGPDDAVRALAHLAGAPISVDDCPAIEAPPSGANPLTGGVLATFDVAGDRLEVWTQRADTIQQLLDLDAGTGIATFPAGPLALGPGPGAFNAPWSWHHDPDEVTMAEAAIEVCDGTPSYVEQNPEQFFQIGYCPWGAELVNLVDYR